MPEEKPGKREWHASEGDFFKSIYDHLKHVATLATGSILLLSTFLERVFKDPLQSWLVGVSIAALFISLVSSMVSYASFLLEFPRQNVKIQDSINRYIAVVGLLTTWLSFLVGVGAIGTFFLINWYAKL